MSPQSSRGKSNSERRVSEIKTFTTFLLAMILAGDLLLGSVGVPFEITRLDALWRFEPSLKAMRGLIHVFTFDHSAVNENLVRLRRYVGVSCEVRDLEVYQDRLAGMAVGGGTE